MPCLIWGRARHPGIEHAGQVPKGRQANTSSFRWRGRAQFHAHSAELRTALLEYRWNEMIIRPLLTGIDSEAPTLF
jgi:hypothetical protein